MGRQALRPILHVCYENENWEKPLKERIDQVTQQDEFYSIIYDHPNVQSDHKNKMVLVLLPILFWHLNNLRNCVWCCRSNRERFSRCGFPIFKHCTQFSTMIPCAHIAWKFIHSPLIIVLNVHKHVWNLTRQILCPNVEKCFVTSI